MAYTYIIYSEIACKFYIGSTSGEIDARIKKHNTNHKGFTGGKGDWELKYFEQFDSILQARTLEREIKGWKSRKPIFTQEFCTNGQQKIGLPFL